MGYRSANSSIVQLKENIEKKNVAIEQFQGKLDDIDKQNNVKHQNMKEETSKEKEQLSNEITLLRDQMEDAQQNIRRKEYLVNEMQQEKDTLCDQLSASYDEREKLQQELLKLKSQTLASDKDTTSDSSDSSLEQRLLEREKEIENLQNQLIELQELKDAISEKDLHTDICSVTTTAVKNSREGKNND